MARGLVAGMSRLYELAALCVALVVVGAVLVGPGIPNEQRIAIIGAILAGLLLLARTRRPR